MAAINSVGNSLTGSTGTGAFVGGTSPTITQPLINNTISGYSTTVTAAANTTLTVSSNYQQFFTGSTTQSVIMPVTSTLTIGQSWLIVNNSSGIVTVKSSGSNNILAMTGGTNSVITCIAQSGTTAADWNAEGVSGVAGVDSITGTANQVIASAATGPVTLSLPQNIGTASAVQFGSVTSSGDIITTAGVLYSGTALGSQGTLALYSPTAAKGILFLQGQDNVGNFNVILKNASFGQSTTFTIPDPGNSTANFIVSQTATPQLINAIKFSTTSGIIGTTTNDNAAAGSVGELISSVISAGSPTGISSLTDTNLTSISLTAGDWDVWGNVGFISAATTNVIYMQGWVSSTSATQPNAEFASRVVNPATGLVYGASTAGIFTVPLLRFSLSGTTTIYLGVRCNFSVDTLSAFGGIYARRRR